MLEILLLVLIVAGAVAGGLYAFDIIPPDSGNGGSESSRQTAQVLRTPVPTPFFPPTSNVPLSTTPASIGGQTGGGQTGGGQTGGGQTGGGQSGSGQTGEQSGAQATPLTPTPAPAGSQAQPPGTRTEPDATSPPPATGGALALTPTPAPGASSGQPATPAPVFDGIYTLTVSQPLNEDFAGKAVTFMIGEFSANETALWQQGQTNVFNLTASSSVFAPGPSGTPLASPLPGVLLSQV